MPRDRGMQTIEQIIDQCPTCKSEDLPLDRRRRVGHNGRHSEPPGAPQELCPSPAGAFGGPVSPTAGVVRGSATMVAADGDNLRGGIAALQCVVAAFAAGATAVRTPLWFRKRATHCAAARQRGLPR